MAKLYFRYGCMGSSKTANALMVAFNYEEKGLKPLVLKPSCECRDGVKTIKSRIGLERKCEFTENYLVAFTDDDRTYKERLEGYDVVIVDEVQFCTPENVYIMRLIVDELKIPVICYGLRNDFQDVPFEASKRLLAVADVIEEIKTVCWCGDGAKVNARLDDKGNVIRSGPQILLGGNESYTSLCRKHWKEGNIGPLKSKYAEVANG